MFRLCWGTKEDTNLQNKNNIKIIITSKFKEKLKNDKKLYRKKKLKYYKEITSPNIRKKNYLSIFLLI